MRRPPTRRARRDRARARSGPGPAGSATAARRPSVASRGSARTSRAGPSSDDPPGVDDQDPAHSPSSRSVLCSATSSAVPVAASARSAVADQPGPLRVELGGRLVEDEVARPHRQERGDRPTSWRLAAGQPARFALGQVLDAEHARARPCVRATVSRAGSPRFIGPSATSSKTDAGHPGQLRGRVLEPDPDPRRELVERLAGHRLAVDRQPAAGQRAADRARREPRRDEAERRLARLVRPDDARRSRRRRGSGRCRGGRSRRSRRSGTRRRRASASAATAGRSTRNATSHDERRDEDPADDAFPRRCRASPRGDGAGPAG